MPNLLLAATGGQLGQLILRHPRGGHPPSPTSLFLTRGLVRSTKRREGFESGFRFEESARVARDGAAVLVQDGS